MSARNLRVGISLMRAEELAGGSYVGVLELAQLADEMGIDEVHVSDHVAVSQAGYDSKGGKFPYPVDYPGWYEPLASLSAIAAVTKRVRLSTNVLVATLRPAILLAKQLATLDVISNGRLDVAFGVGWQKAEFEAAEMPWEGRYAYIDEQIRVCRLLWSELPASHHGKRVKFRNLYMAPLPPQRGGLPIWLGYDAKPRNVQRIAEQADGWAGPPVEPAILAEGVRAIHAELAARGRTTADFAVRTTLRPVKRADGSTDWDASFARAPEYAKAGATMLAVIASQYCREAGELPALIGRLTSLQAI